MQERLVDIEVRITHLESTCNDLSDMLYAQQGLLERLARSCEELRQRMEARDQAAEAVPAAEKPPHY